MACTLQGLTHLLRYPIPSQPHTNRTTTLSPLFLKFDPSSLTLSTRIKRSISAKKKKKNTTQRSSFLCSATESEEEVISGEWPENFSLLNYDDLRAHLEPEIFKDKMEPSTLLGEVMSTTIRTATVGQTLEEIDHHFEIVSGLPVIDDDFVCIGVVSKKDKEKATDGLKTKVGEIMSSPAITLTPNKTVLGIVSVGDFKDAISSPPLGAMEILKCLASISCMLAEAAVFMLKEKFHRIPIVNEGGQVVGIVTRTDIFKALEGVPA